MDTTYWDLFWKTGMPEVWLMSRDSRAAPLTGGVQGAAQGLASPQVTPSAAPVSDVPGSLKNIY